MAPPGHQLLEIQSTKHASGRSDRAQTAGCGRIEATDHMTTAAQRSTKQNAHIVVIRRFDVRHAEQTRSKWSILVKENDSRADAQHKIGRNRIMTSGSARIYQFPARGRFAASGQREESEPAANATLPRDVKVVASSGWYHDEAIQEAERARKN